MITREKESEVLLTHMGHACRVRNLARKINHYDYQCRNNVPEPVYCVCVASERLCIALVRALWRPANSRRGTRRVKGQSGRRNTIRPRIPKNPKTCDTWRYVSHFFGFLNFVFPLITLVAYFHWWSELENRFWKHTVSNLEQIVMLRGYVCGIHTFQSY